MDDDLTRRLRDADHVAFAQITDDLSVRCSEDYALAEQAADTIDALRERVKVLEGALKEIVDIERSAWSLRMTSEGFTNAGIIARTALKDADT